MNIEKQIINYIKFSSVKMELIKVASIIASKNKLTVNKILHIMQKMNNENKIHVLKG